jgi:hypothetical protein
MKLSVAALTALALIVATSVAAETVTITYRGTVVSGADPLELFGGGTLAGDSFTAVYTITLGRGAVMTDGSTYSFWANTATPAGIVERMTINGSSVEIFGAVSGPNNSYRLHGFNNPTLNMAFGLGPGPLFGFESAVDSGSPALDLGENVIISTDPITPDYDFTSPWSYTAGAADHSAGFFDYGRDGFNLYNASVSVAAVPEPGVWTLMLCGFGLIGASLRAKRSQPAH